MPNLSVAMATLKTQTIPSLVIIFYTCHILLVEVKLIFNIDYDNIAYIVSKLLVRFSIKLILDSEFKIQPTV